MYTNKIKDLMHILKRLLIIIILLFSSCKKQDPIGEIQVDLSIHRFDQAFSKIKVDKDVNDLRILFPMFMSPDISNEQYLLLANSEENQQLQKAVDGRLKNEDLKKELETVFQSLSFYFPEHGISNSIYTLIGDGDSEQKIILTDEVLIIAVDQYLGESSPYYSLTPKYLRPQFNSNHIGMDLTKAFIGELPQGRRFVDHMVTYGKWIYLYELLCRTNTLSDNLDYTQDQLIWAMDNEYEIWAYFVEEDLLFSTDLNLVKRFLDPAPFSKFYKGFDNETPGRLGVYIGYQIVSSFMRNNDVSLPQLLRESPQIVFEQSGFKPKK